MSRHLVTVVTLYMFIGLQPCACYDATNCFVLPCLFWVFSSNHALRFLGSLTSKLRRRFGLWTSAHPVAKREIGISYDGWLPCHPNQRAVQSRRLSKYKSRRGGIGISAVEISHSRSLDNLRSLWAALNSQDIARISTIPKNACLSFRTLLSQHR